jgi:hypothetical protein
LCHFETRVFHYVNALQEKILQEVYRGKIVHEEHEETLMKRATIRRMLRDKGRPYRRGSWNGGYLMLSAMAMRSSLLTGTLPLAVK